MDVNVKYNGENILIKNVKTVEELKEKLGEANRFREFVFDEWKLFHNEVELDNPQKRLVELEDGVQGITLVEPEEKTKGEGEVSREITTDNTCYIIVNDREGDKIHKIEGSIFKRVKVARKYYLLGSQEIGFIKRIWRNNSSAREVECTMYDVKSRGCILLWTRYGSEEVQLTTGRKTEQLNPGLNKTYHENILMSGDDSLTKESILDQIEQHFQS